MVMRNLVKNSTVTGGYSTGYQTLYDFNIPKRLNEDDALFVVRPDSLYYRTISTNPDIVLRPFFGSIM